jgi:hypothetical protein
VKFYFTHISGLLARLFTKAVIDDGGTVLSASGTKNGFHGSQGASLVCPCSASDEGKLYLWEL